MHHLLIVMGSIYLSRHTALPFWIFLKILFSLDPVQRQNWLSKFPHVHTFCQPCIDQGCPHTHTHTYRRGIWCLTFL
ncbi:uncharacterized protein BDW43DRAFT_277029 [Aspergillus alliaceus]|uniref:uncharacterized protein n=1 Tax=Petromyces alliaceus TaxID=209559 RepID=UPI0012A6B3A1|nr:uncharacterized protein BDW43DRAFT_277029 [Aspergillus alliaceus]KAB8233341.1 hypothetical protein BDW43DRAFT_277029 [Aspergillus alliaceus]